MAVFVAVNIPRFWLTLYIGILVLVMGLIILCCVNRQFRFSWRKISLLGAIASFNKGMSGGGYGPVVTCGQILSGLEGRHAVGITSLAEGLTCLVGVICYIFVAGKSVDWGIGPWIISGAVLSVPLSVVSVKKITTGRLTMAIGILTVVLGSFTILKTLL